jgi:hypothetical protein
MATKAFCSTIVAGLVLTGCGQQLAPPPPASAPCNAGVCKVDISVSMSGDRCVAVANPDTIQIDKRNRGPTIQWDISTSGYKFAPNLKGITINGNPSQFSRPLNPTPTKFMWIDANDDTVKYKYTVSVMKDDKPCDLLDPFIANGQ